MGLRSQSFPLPHLWGWKLNLLAYMELRLSLVLMGLDHHKKIHHSFMITLALTPSIGYTIRVKRLTMHPPALATLGMACLIFLRLVQHLMSNRLVTLVLRLGTLPFLSMQIGLVIVVTLHNPLQRWQFLHTHILDLALVFLFWDLSRDM